MKVLPRNWYFYYGRVRLYRRLYACARVLALIAGAMGIGYLNLPEVIQLRPTTVLSICNHFQTAMRALLAGLRYVRESPAIRRTSTGTATASPANHGGASRRRPSPHRVGGPHERRRFRGPILARTRTAHCWWRWCLTTL
jgi:hypothetical protein